MKKILKKISYKTVMVEKKQRVVEETEVDLCINKMMGKKGNISLQGYINEGVLKIVATRASKGGSNVTNSFAITKQELEDALAQMK